MAMHPKHQLTQLQIPKTSLKCSAFNLKMLLQIQIAFNKSKIVFHVLNDSGCLRHQHNGRNKKEKEKSKEYKKKNFGKENKQKTCINII